MDSIINTESERFARLISNLEALNPLSVMMRGFCILTDIEKGSIIGTIDKLQKDMSVKIRLTDGSATCNIISKERK